MQILFDLIKAHKRQETPFHFNMQPTLHIAKVQTQPKTKTTDIQNIRTNIPLQHQKLDVI